jgi:hypothetical protein
MSSPRIVRGALLTALPWFMLSTSLAVQAPPVTPQHVVRQALARNERRRVG